MTIFHTLGDFVAHLSTIEAYLELAREAAVVKGCQIVQKEAKAAIGNYRAGYNWPQLAESTQEDRVRKGFPANEPLLRTGSLRESIEYTAPPFTRARKCAAMSGRTIPSRNFRNSGRSRLRRVHSSAARRGRKSMKSRTRLAAW
jgi:hypothetical protein